MNAFEDSAEEMTFAVGENTYSNALEPVPATSGGDDTAAEEDREALEDRWADGCSARAIFAM